MANEPALLPNPDIEPAAKPAVLNPSPFAGGSGTKNDPYQVATQDQLQRVGQFLSAYFVQTQDIDASSTAGGKGFKPIGNNSNPFTGSYNGKGHTISGLTIDRPNTLNVGLFGVVGSGGALNNVQLKNVDITGKFHVGGLVGDNSGSITGSYATGSVTLSNSGQSQAATGGLVGVNRDRGSVTASYASVAVKANGYRAATGGFVGVNSGSITASYATGSVTGGGTQSHTGGLVGANGPSGSITASYATGKVSASSGSVGGLVGESNGGSITDSYWDTNTTNQIYPTFGSTATGLTTAEMQGTNAINNMKGFDFTAGDGDAAVWKVQTSPDDYPILIGVGGQ